MKKNELSHIWDILNACYNVESFVGSLTHEEFEEDIKTQSAVFHQFMVMGEATKRLSTDFKNSYDSIPWKKIAGFRDILIHQYDNIVPNEVWQIIKNSVPDLIISLKNILEESN